MDLRDHEQGEVARDRAEGIRVAYVAATRARDLLVVPAVGDGPYESGWTGVLNTALYPIVGSEGADGPGCPPFGKDTVMERPDGEGRHAVTVVPGLHEMAAGPVSAAAHGAGAAYGVVWWDPAVLPHPPSARGGLRRMDLIMEGEPSALAADEQAYRDWEAAREQAIRLGAVPSLRVVTVTERAVERAAQGEEPPAIDVVEVGPAVRQRGQVAPNQGTVPLWSSGEDSARADDARPAGVRFGTLVHELLATLPLDADDAAIEGAARQRGRLLGASAREASAAVPVVRAALDHDVFRRARAADAGGRCRRETPVTWREADGSLVEGQVDLAFEEADGWCVVDFKTDRRLDAALPVHRQQLGLYVRAIAAATGRPARGVLLRV
jgi:hypothetical protein